MITSNELKGIMAMMPAFTTKDGDRPGAEDTVDTAELTRAVDQIIRDGGVNVLTTTGSFGILHRWTASRTLAYHSARNHRQQQKDRGLLEEVVREVPAC